MGQKTTDREKDWEQFSDEQWQRYYSIARCTQKVRDACLVYAYIYSFARFMLLMLLVMGRTMVEEVEEAILRLTEAVET